MRISRITQRHLRGGRPVALSLLMGLVLVALGSTPALARSSTPEYLLEIVEGESTHPNQAILTTHGSANTRVQVTVSIIHGGIVVARQSNPEWVWMSQVPEVGDEVTLEVGGTLIASMIYDGLPSIDATVCAGSANFSGQRTAGPYEVEGGQYSFKAFPTTEPGPLEQAQVTVLSGASFGGNFLKPLAIGETVLARETSKTTLASGAIFQYRSENQRPVGACPPPPPPPPAPPVVVLPPLKGSILKLTRASIRNLLKSGWLTEVYIDEPGTVTEDLFAEGGRLPAHASAVSSAKHHRSPPPALLLARGSASTKAAGKVNVVLHPTGKGRSVLKRAARIKAVLITTLRNANGAQLTLSRHTVMLTRQ